MRQSRRIFLGSLGAGLTFFSLPEISPWFRLLNPTGGPDGDLAETVHRLLFGESSSGLFVARAETRMIEGTPQPLLDTPSALLKILDTLGFDRSFSSRVNNEKADQCENEFIAQENSWRRQGFNAFTKINRSAIDHQVAFGVGGNIDANSNLVKAAGATQYEDQPAVPLTEHDAPIGIAVKWLMDKNLSGKEVAQVLALTEKKNVTMEGGQTATRYETPVTNSVYIPQPRRNSRVSNAVGVIATNLKKDPGSIYFTDLYA